MERWVPYANDRLLRLLERSINGVQRWPVGAVECYKCVTVMDVDKI